MVARGCLGTLIVKYFLRFLTAGLTFFPLLVFAQEQARKISFTPPTTDYSVVFLGNIFGVIDGVLYGGGATILGELFGMFNAAVVFIGGIIIIYIFVVSTLNTAQEGEFLGRKWNSMWVPVRAVVGIIMIFPKASGYCLMQVFIMWLVLQGVGAGDMVWSAALDYLQRGGVIISARTDVLTETTGSAASPFGGTGNVSPFGSYSASTDKEKVAGNMLKSAICLRALEQSLYEQRQADLKNGLYQEGDPQDLGPVPDLNGSVNFIEAQTEAEESNLTRSGPPTNPLVPLPDLPSSSPYAGLNGVCGELSWKLLSSSEQAQIRENIGSTAPNIDSQLNEINQARAVAVQQMYIEMNTVAQRIVDNYANATDENPARPLGYLKNDVWVPPDALTQGDEIKNAARAFFAIMSPTLNALQNEVKDETDFVEEARKKGWIMAGTYYIDLVKTQRNINALLDQTGSVTVDNKVLSQISSCSDKNDHTVRASMNLKGVSPPTNFSNFLNVFE